MNEQKLRKLIREALLLEQSGAAKFGELQPWPEKLMPLFFAGANGIGRGEYLLAMTLAGITEVNPAKVDLEGLSRLADSYKKLTDPKFSGQRDWWKLLGYDAREDLEYEEGTKVTSRKAYIDKLKKKADILGKGQIPSSIEGAAGSAGNPYDVWLKTVDQIPEGPDAVSSTMEKIKAQEMNESNPDGLLIRGTIPESQYQGAKIEVKEPDPKGQFRMSAEGANFLCNSTAYNDLKMLGMYLIKFRDEAEPHYMRAKSTLDSIPAKLSDILDPSNRGYYDEVSKITSAENPVAKDRLKLLQKIITDFKDFCQDETFKKHPNEDIRAISDVACTYESALAINTFVRDPGLLSSPENVMQKIVTTVNKKFTQLFHDAAGVEYIAFVSPQGYVIYPTDPDSLFKDRLLTLVSISQGRPRWKVKGLESVGAPGGQLEADSDTPDACPLGEDHIRDIRLLIREALLLEELTKTDKAEIKRIAKKQAKSVLDSELDKALSVSFFGNKGKVNKFVDDEINRRFKAGDKDKDFSDAVEKVAKRVLQALYTMHYKRNNLIKTMPVPKG